MSLTPAQWLGDDPSHIEKLSEQQGLMPQALRAWRAMNSAAAKDGLTLNIVSSYRNFARQQAIWNAKFQGLRPVLDDNEQAITLEQLSMLDKAMAILRFSALPGASRHHWGTELDVYSAQLQIKPLQLLASEYQAGGPQHAVSQWLDDRAHEFDFYKPYRADLGGVAAEPWHISFAPLAESIQAKTSAQVLAKRLQLSDVMGKDVIVTCIDSVFDRFITRISPYIPQVTGETSRQNECRQRPSTFK